MIPRVLNQLLKFTLVSSLLLWLKPRWKGLLALSAGVILVHVFHGEYLGYVELSGNDEHLPLSYLVKWVLLFAILGIYIGYLMLGGKAKGGENKSKTIKVTRSEPPAVAADDGFDFLRNKKALQGEADKVIAGKPGSDKGE